MDRSLRLLAIVVGCVLVPACLSLPGAAQPRTVAARGAHCADGTALTVGPGGDYTRITDALAQARRIRFAAGELERARRAICIEVAAGTYVGTFIPETLAANPGYEAFPLLVDVPSVHVRGATTLAVDANGRPTALSDTATALVADPRPADDTHVYFLATTTERAAGERVLRSRGNDVRIEGFVLDLGACGAGSAACLQSGDSPLGASGELARRGGGIRTHFVQEYIVRGNVVVGAGSFGVQHSFSSGRTIGNLLTRNSPTGLAYRGPASGKTIVLRNTSTHNAAGGMVLVCSAGNFSLPVLAHERGVSVVPGPADGTLARSDIELIENNFSQHVQDPHFSFGLRVMMFGFQEDMPAEASCAVTARRNVMTATSFGVIMDGGFPYRTLDGLPTEKVWRAQFRGRYEGNEVQGNTENALVSLTRFTSTRDCRELDPSLATSFAFLRDSSYAIRHGGELDGACIDNRALDPIDGEPLGNRLRIGVRSLAGLTCAQTTACD